MLRKSITICIVSITLISLLTGGTKSAQATNMTTTTFLKVVAGSAQTAAIDIRGDVYTWGINNVGQLGIGTSDMKQHPIPVKVKGLPHIVDISVGGGHTLALTSKGEVYSWGSNNNGQLGNDSKIDSKVPIKVSQIPHVSSISAGSVHSVAVTKDGSVYVWGIWSNSQIGRHKERSLLPYKIEDLKEIVKVEAGGVHTLAIDIHGYVWGFGDNGAGQLGTGDHRIFPKPIRIPGMSNVDTIIASSLSSFALTEEGTLWAWGYNERGQAGLGTQQYIMEPRKVLEHIQFMAAGDDFAIAVDHNGDCWGWGDNKQGYLGNGLPKDIIRTPQKMDGLHNITYISAFSNHFIVKDNLGNYHAWGDNYFGQIGIENVMNSESPIKQAIPLLSKNNDIIIKMNNSFIDSDQPPLHEKGSILLPIRAVLEAMGVIIHESDDTLIATKDDVNVTLKINSQHASINDIPITLISPAIVRNGRTYVPLRFISESFGSYVSWDSVNRIVTISD
jgi:alpha-tubulin suppressor-like RCC1 family protein